MHKEVCLDKSVGAVLETKICISYISISQGMAGLVSGSCYHDLVRGRCVLMDTALAIVTPLDFDTEKRAHQKEKKYITQYIISIDVIFLCT